MFKKNMLLLLLFSFMFLTGCPKKFSSTEQTLPVGVNPGETYYTQFSLFQEKNNFRTTNYRRGGLIPINTPVSLVSMDSSDIVVKLRDSGQNLNIENVQKHTNEDIQQAFKKILDKRKVDLNQFSKEEQQNILAGQVTKGMRRKAVLAAIGYPPANSTPTLETSEWMYWNNRFDRFIVRFKGDVVEQIVN